jgi:putative transposase
MVEELRSQVDVKFCCKVLSVSRSGFYAWFKRPESERKKETEKLLAKIRETHSESRGTYGSPRVHAALKRQGVRCGKNRVAKVMRVNDIKAVTRRKFRVVTTDSRHTNPIAERIFETEKAREAVVAPNQVWAGDITYIETREGWLYLAVFLDVFTRKIVGHSMRENMQTGLVLDALEMAMGRQEIDDLPLVVHSDRGIQYASSDFRERLNEEGITPSMSRKGNCYDNAYAETFFKTLKTELVYQRNFGTRSEARSAIFEYIEVFYNRQRLHSSLGYLTPEEYELAV